MVAFCLCKPLTFPWNTLLVYLNLCPPDCNSWGPKLNALVLCSIDTDDSSFGTQFYCICKLLGCLITESRLWPLSFHFTQPEPDTQRSNIYLCFSHHQPGGSWGRFVTHIWTSCIGSNTIHRHQYLRLNILRTRMKAIDNYARCTYEWAYTHIHTQLLQACSLLAHLLFIPTSEWHWHSGLHK